MRMKLTLLLSAFAVSAALAYAPVAVAQSAAPIDKPKQNQKKGGDDKKGAKSAPKPDDRKGQNNRAQDKKQDKKQDSKKDDRRDKAQNNKPDNKAQNNKKDDKRDNNARDDRSRDNRGPNNKPNDNKANDNRRNDDRANDNRPKDNKDNNRANDNNRDKDNNRSAGDRSNDRDRGDRKKKIEEVRSERKETKEGNRTIIRENNRTIIKVDNRTIIRHDETDRFRRGGGEVRVDRRGNNTETVIMRPGGVRVVNVVDDRGRLVRRSRWVNGREYVLIDNHYNQPGPGFGFVVNLGPPVIGIPRERYIVDYAHAPRELVYETLVAPPVMALDRRFTLDEIRYNRVVRERMPSIDISAITFESGSWDVSPDQARLLAPMADAMARAIEKNPREMYLIGGHTDAAGDREDNLSLSDRRAEAVAEVLTEMYNVPPENLVTQGYGEDNLKVPVQGPEPRNRYVSVRRITPLLAQN